MIKFLIKMSKLNKYIQIIYNYYHFAAQQLSKTAFGIFPVTCKFFVKLWILT